VAASETVKVKDSFEFAVALPIGQPPDLPLTRMAPDFDLALRNNGETRSFD
jgi:hypothetical protein